MYSFIAECKVITPMFMAGADGKTPELRPSEFKGMMRFWWRAIKAEDNIESLKSEENKIFGGTGDKEEKSKVKLVIQNNTLSINDNILSEIGNNNGLKYLYYSTFSLKSRGQPIIRKYIKPNSIFRINLFSFEETIFDQTLASLWLAIYLGGFGTRARRGGGNLVIEKIINNFSKLDKLNFTCNVSSKEELKIWLSRNISAIKKIINQSTGTAKYSTLKNGKILMFDPMNSWKEALNFIGEKFKEFRIENESKIFETAVFGMPIMHSRFSRRIVPYDSKRISDRWASPIFIKVLKGGDGKYYPIITQLLPGGIKSIGEEEKTDKGWKMKAKEVFNLNLLNEFINWLKTSNSEEIKL